MFPTFTEENQHTCFFLLGARSVFGSIKQAQPIISLLENDSDGGMDYCSFGNLFGEPSNSELLAYAENQESCGSIAYAGSSESCGSIASSAGISSSTVSSCSCACSYCC